MIKKAIAAMLSAAFICTATGCSEIGAGAQLEITRYTAEFLFLFDTVTQLVAYRETEEEFTAFAEFIREGLTQYHQLYDIYDDYEGVNNIKTINDNAGIAPVEVDRRIIELLLHSKDLYELTNGKCDIALGPVLEIWHQNRIKGIEDPANAALPDREALQAALQFCDIDRVIIDEEGSTVFLPEPEMSLDVGAIAKGYATDRVCLEAIDAGYGNALVSVGGNVRVIGDKDGNGTLWNVGVDSPYLDDPSILLTVLLEDASLVASGDYQRYYTVDGEIYHHIIDPDTLMPARHVKMVSVVCPEGGMADALSTALFNMPWQEGLELVDSLEDVEAMWVLLDGEYRFSAGFEDLVQTKE